MNMDRKSQRRNHSNPELESVRIWHPAGFKGVELWDVRNTRMGATIFHESYALCNVQSISNAGTGDWWYRHKTFRSATGNTMMMEPGETHITRNITTRATYKVVTFTQKMVLEAAAQAGLRGVPHISQPNMANPEIFKAINSLHKCLGDETSLPVERESRLTSLFSLFFDSSIEIRPKGVGRPETCIGVLTARDCLLEDFRTRWTLDELAGIAGLSRFHFLRSFKKTFGLPPHAFQNHLRLSEAKKKLSKGIPIAEIDVGFADQSHLIRHFRRSHVGVTPGVYACGGIIQW